MLNVLTTLTFILFVLQNPLKQIPLPGFGSLDEGLTAILFIGAFSIQLAARRISKLSLVPIILYAYQIVVSLGFGTNRDPLEIALQSFISIKFFLLVSPLYELSRRRHYSFERAMFVLAGITLIGLFLNLVLGQYLFTLMHASPTMGAGDPQLERLAGFQLNANAAGVALAFAAICLLARLQAEGRGRPYEYLGLLLLTGGVLATASRTALAFELLGLVFFVRFRRSALPALLTVAMVALLLLTQQGIMNALVEKTTENVGAVAGGPEANYPRWLMAYYGVQLAAMHFPIGTGAATFGSVFSAGSPIYDQLGLSAFQSIADLGGIYDSNFGSIAGEYGLLGIVAFYGALWYCVRKLSRSSRSIGGRWGLTRVEWLFTLVGVLATFMRPLFSSSYYGSLFLIALFACVQAVKGGHLLGKRAKGGIDVHLQDAQVISASAQGSS